MQKLNFNKIQKVDDTTKDELREKQQEDNINNIKVLHKEERDKMVKFIQDLSHQSRDDKMTGTIVKSPLSQILQNY